MKRLSAVLVIVGLVLLVAPPAVVALMNVWVARQQSIEQTRWRANLEAPRQKPTARAVMASPSVAPPFLLSIPKIKLRWMIHEGTTIRDLRRTGAGHIPQTALPGQRGVVGIAGHRTTYGAPFFKLDHVGVGDEITLQTHESTFVYRVYKMRTVKPTQVEVLKSTTGERLLVLSTCTPANSARFRLVIFAKMVPEPSAASGGTN